MSDEEAIGYAHRHDKSAVQFGHGHVAQCPYGQMPASDPGIEPCAGGGTAKYAKELITRRCSFVYGPADHQVVLHKHRLDAFDQDAESSRLTLPRSRGATYSNEWRLEPPARMASAPRDVSVEATTERQVMRFDVGRPRAGVPISVRHYRSDANLDPVAKADAARGVIELPFRQRRVLRLNGRPQDEDIDIRPSIKLALRGGCLDMRLGRDCDDLQFLRELTQNSLEAGATRIQWDFDPHIFGATGVQKLCCVDDGCGMTPDEMRHYINRLSASGQRQALDANYGVGAKVAAATRNPAGVIYQSWRDGKGAMIQLWRDPDTGEYGLRRFEMEDGHWSFWIPLNDSAKPDVIGEHGTKVILLGRDEDHNTMQPPEGILVATPSRWVTRYLNARYLHLSENVDIRAREGWDGNPDDKRNLMRGVRGQGRFLTDHIIQSGVADLADCHIHWWILDEPEKRRTASDLVNTGHAATLWHNELYEMRTGRAGVTRLHQFGIIFGYERVVLYVEPHNGSKQPITSNTARTQLLLHGQALPYADWAAEFRDNMPQELRDFMDAVIAGAKGADHQEAIAERLKHYRKLYKLSRYRLNPQGKLTLAEPVLPRRKPRTETGEPTDRETEPRPPRPRDRTGRLLAAMLAAEGESGDQAQPSEQDLPKVTWVSLENGLRDTPEYLDDRAAAYISEVNEIHINADFRAFIDMADYWCDQYGVDRGNKAITDVVHEWFEQAVVETVLGCQALQGERRWPPDQVEKALSEEALTAAVMQRYHLANAIKRTLGAKLGSLKEKSDAA